MKILEFCAENYTNIEKAIKNGAKRIELCDNLAVGGTTPSYGVIKESVKLASMYNVPIMTIIRPRGGNFVYSSSEMEIMLQDIKMAKRAGASGIVIGCLNKFNWIDEKLMEKLIFEGKNMDITFHMAFDVIPDDKQFAAIDWIFNHGIKRILTHGGMVGTNIFNNFSHISKLIEYGKNKLTIMPGGGITSKNLNTVIEKLSVNEIHGTKIVKLD